MSATDSKKRDIKHIDEEKDSQTAPPTKKQKREHAKGDQESYIDPMLKKELESVGTFISFVTDLKQRWCAFVQL